MKEKYYKWDKIRLFEMGNKKYVQLVSDANLEVLRFAQSRGYVQKLNDAKRGGKLGEYYFVKRYFDFERMKKSMFADRDRKERALKRALKSVLPADKIDSFGIISDIGSIVVNGVEYSNFYGDGMNTVDICECDFEDFKTAEIITRRQVYNKAEPITIVKFDELQSIKVQLVDCDEKEGIRVIDNVCGFAIWERKMKVFVANSK